ncbi:MAG TPA: hypothetical protein VJ752_01765, partial [Burkholderiaceae bacterium]|nr:hypothetical protein [Burkholderiaceae bacterium]
QRRTLKQLHEDLKELGFEGSYDRVAAFARVWREGQNERVNPSSKRTRHHQFFARTCPHLPDLGLTEETCALLLNRLAG